MAPNNRYHRLPEENRLSMDTIADDERLLGPVSEVSDEPTSRSNQKEVILSYHPTFIIRFINLILLTIGLAFFVVSRQRRAIAAIVFVCMALLRNVTVLLLHLIGRWVHFRMEIVGNSSSPLKGNVPSWLKRGRIQVAIDLAIVLGLLIAVPMAYNNGHGDNYWRNIPQRAQEACVLGFISIPLQLVSAFDIGNPNRFPLKMIIIIDKSGGIDTGTIYLPSSSWDTEAATTNPAVSQKTVADSPVCA